MPKRSLDEGQGGCSKTKKQTHVESDEELVFSVILSEKIFTHRRTNAEECAAQYIAKMRLNPQPTLDGLAAHILAAHPDVNANIATIWNRLCEFFVSGKAAADPDINRMGDINTFVSRFEAEDLLKDAQVSPPDVNNVSKPPAALSTSASSAPPTTGSQASSRSTKASGSSSSSSTTILSARAVMAMKDEFNRNFKAFRGASWKLPSGACVDDLVADHVRTLTKEAALHSFVLDDPAILLSLVSDPEDEAVLNAVLVQRDGERSDVASNVEKRYLRRYDQTPAVVDDMLADGWRHLGKAEGQLPDEPYRKAAHVALLLVHTLYQNSDYTLPESASESFYLQNLWGFLSTVMLCDGRLRYRPAEVHSQASAQRKNKDRRAESAAKQAPGRRVDGIIVSSQTLLELCVLEAARKDQGPNGTKALTDARKLSKVLKDSFDAICAKANSDISLELVVYGVRIAGPTITFYSMRKRPGRLYQMIHDGCVSFPPKWNATSTTTVLTVIASVLALRKRVCEMEEKISGWVSCSFELFDTSSHPTLPPTLATPQGSPRS